MPTEKRPLADEDEELYKLLTSDLIDAEATLEYMGKLLPAWELTYGLNSYPDCLWECLIEAYPNAHFHANRRAYAKLYMALLDYGIGYDDGLTTPQVHALLEPSLQETFFHSLPSMQTVRTYDHLGWLKLLRPGDNPAFLWLWLLQMLYEEDYGSSDKAENAYWLGKFEAKLAELMPHKPTLAEHALPCAEVMIAWMHDPYDTVDINFEGLLEPLMLRANVEYQQLHGERPRFKTTITSVVRRNTLAWLTRYFGAALRCSGPVLQAVAHGWHGAWHVNRRAQY